MKEFFLKLCCGCLGVKTFRKWFGEKAVCDLFGHEDEFSDENACFGFFCKRCGRYRLLADTEKLIEIGYLAETEYSEIPKETQKEIRKLINGRKFNG